MGYVVKVRPQLAQGKLILFDRYFPDCLIDPKRYRLPASCVGMAGVVAKLLPKPDLSVVLDAPATVLQQRKCEVTPAESERQRKDYLMRLATGPNAVVVDAARPLVKVVEDVQNCMIEFHLTRFPRRCELT
jgi:thymidylate kinase